MTISCAQWPWSFQLALVVASDCSNGCFRKPEWLLCFQVASVQQPWSFQMAPKADGTSWTMDFQRVSCFSTDETKWNDGSFYPPPSSSLCHHHHHHASRPLFSSLVLFASCPMSKIAWCLASGSALEFALPAKKWRFFFCCCFGFFFLFMVRTWKVFSQEALVSNF